MNSADSVRIEFRSKQPDNDERSLNRHLKTDSNLQVRMKLVETAPWVERICQFFVKGLPGIEAYAGKKLFDLIIQRVQDWLDNRESSVSEATIYGPNGEVVKVVKRSKQ